MSTFHPTSQTVEANFTSDKKAEHNNFFMVKRREKKLLTSINEDLHQIKQEESEDAGKKLSTQYHLEGMNSPGDAKITNYSQLLLKGNRQAKTTLLNFDLTDPGESRAKITENIDGESETSKGLGSKKEFSLGESQSENSTDRKKETRIKIHDIKSFKDVIDDTRHEKALPKKDRLN